jgi:hypothetical protein
MDEADEIAPLVAVFDASQRTLPIETPNRAQDGLQPDAVFVDRSKLDDAVRERGGDFAYERAGLF